MERRKTTKWLDTQRHSPHSSHMSVKRHLKQLLRKTLFLRRMRTDKTTGKCPSFEYTLVIFGNNYRDRLSILLVHLQVSTLKSEKDTRDMTFFKEALTDRKRC